MILIWLHYIVVCVLEKYTHKFYDQQIWTEF